MRSLIAVAVTIATMLAFAAWGWWDFATPTTIEIRSGTLAGFTIGQLKPEVLLRHAGSLESLRPADSAHVEIRDSITPEEALLQAETWDANVAVAECPERKRCPSTTLWFEGDRLSTIRVKCHSCP